MAGEGHVVDRRVPDGAVDRHERGLSGQTTSVGQLPGPEVVEVGRLVDVGLIGTQFGERQIGEHGNLGLSGCERRSAGTDVRAKSQG